MFESFNFTEQKEEECEECLARDFLVDAIVDGKQKRICRRCVIANNAIELKKPNAIQLDAIHRPSVRDAMFRASGIMPKPIQPSQTMHAQPKLEDLRARYEELKKKRAEEQAKKENSTELLQLLHGKPQKPEVLDEKEFVDYIEKLPKEITTTQAQLTPQPQQISQKKLQSGQTSKQNEVAIDFSIEATKRTRIRDLLERMKRLDEEAEAKEREKLEQALEEKMKKDTNADISTDSTDSAGYEEKI